ncbi:PLP-dependent transferase [Vararia minispora EC-137]|uniref:PLP-dependent transferase n=1 Tax=Vararia minispora EC-137 TaxID=1314806 RepID=A0ACB8Q5Q3_9AGAM|nr:PLP-dependent transferase [Vararia minispora EC-137]
MFDFVTHARSRFPALASGYIFADNAGGSQCLQTVADRITDYLLHTNVQLGADYAVSVESTRRAQTGTAAAAALFNALSPSEIALGPSSTMLAENLARALEPNFHSGDEIIITEEHEANGGPWKKLAARKGLTIKTWHPRSTSPENPYAIALDVLDLLPLITDNTRLIAFTACSNILGSLVPIKAIVRAARAKAAERGARKVEFCIDCVAYAPHRRIDVQDWDVEYCFFSFYKVYGPHVSALYARASALQASVAPLTHHFLHVDNVAYKLMPGGLPYELAYGLTAVLPYLLSLAPAGVHAHNVPPEQISISDAGDALQNAFDAIAAHEQTLLEPLLAFLRAQAPRGVRIVGTEDAGLARVPTVSFVVGGERALHSRDVVAVFDAKGGIGIRYGHFYAHTLVNNLEPKIDIDDAVVRVSLVHYNTVEEVARIIQILEEVLA